MAIACLSKHTSMALLRDNCSLLLLLTHKNLKEEQKKYATKTWSRVFFVNMLIVLMNVGVKCHSPIPAYSSGAFISVARSTARALFSLSAMPVFFYLWPPVYRCDTQCTLSLITQPQWEYVVLYNLTNTAQKLTQTHVSYARAHINFTIMRSFSVYITITC